MRGWKIFQALARREHLEIDLPNALNLPLSTFSLRLGACLSADGSSLTFAGKDSGCVMLGPHLPAKIGFYTFVVDILFPAREMPRAQIDIFGDDVLLASKRISTHCNTIEIQAYVSANCALQVRLHSEQTPFEIKRITYALGVGARATGVAEIRERMRCTLAGLLGVNSSPDAPPEWIDPKMVANALFGDNHFQMISIQSLDQHEALWQQVGVMPALIQAFFTQNNGADSEGTASGDLVDGFPKLTNAFQQAVVASGCLELLSPYDGSVIRTQNSIPVPVLNGTLSIVYEFQGKHPIVIGTSTSWAGNISFVWLVTHDIIINDNTVEWMNWLNPEQVISEYISLCVRCSDKIKTYRSAEHKPALASGYFGNMGHYFWNEISGLERLLRLTNLEGVETIYTPGSKWLSVRDIFAADQLPEIVEIDDLSKLVEEVLERKQLLVRPTGTQLDAALACKIQHAAEARFALEAPERRRAAQELASDGQYVLYVNLRSHNKSWVEQDIGIVAIIHALRSEYKGDIVVYLDGYADCEDSVRSIVSTAIERVTYVVGLGGTHAGFSETLHWAFRCDFFIAVIGSGLVPLTWIANRPGICYSETHHLTQMDFWPDVRHDSAPLGWPRIDQIQDHEDHADQTYCSYSIEPEIVVNLFLDVWRRTRPDAQIRNLATTTDEEPLNETPRLQIAHAAKINRSPIGIEFYDTTAVDWHLMAITSPAFQNQHVTLKMTVVPSLTCDTEIYINHVGGVDILSVSPKGDCISGLARNTAKVSRDAAGALSIEVTYYSKYKLILIGTSKNGNGIYQGTGSLQFIFTYISIIPSSAN